MELDSSSAVSIISEATLKRLCPNGGPRLRPSPMTLMDFQRNRVPIWGVESFRVQYQGLDNYLHLIVVEGNLVSLLGCVWFGPLGILIKGVQLCHAIFRLIAAVTPAEFASRLRTVLRRFHEAGLKVKQEKCLLGVQSVDFLDFTVDADGLHLGRDKIKAIVEPPPQVQGGAPGISGAFELLPYLLPHREVLAEPLHHLLDKQAQWTWGSHQAAAFMGVKALLISNKVLVHFDEILPVVLACDASPYGVSAVLAHRLPDKQEVPVVYYSWMLLGAERHYAQIDREGLAIMAGVKKFHDYVYDQPFTITADHCLLLGLFAADCQMPQVKEETYE